MGVSIQGGGGRGMMPDLNLVPFIDFMSCLIAFLMMTAVWADLSVLEANQAVSSSAEAPEVPPLRVTVSAGEVALMRAEESRVVQPRTAGQVDFAALRGALELDRRAFPAHPALILEADDGVAYGDLISVLDATAAAGYDAPSLAGGPPAAATPG